MSVSGAIADS